MAPEAAGRHRFLLSARQCTSVHGCPGGKPMPRSRKRRSAKDKKARMKSRPRPDTAAGRSSWSTVPRATYGRTRPAPPPGTQWPAFVESPWLTWAAFSALRAASPEDRAGLGGFGGSIWDRCGGLRWPHIVVGWRSDLAPPGASSALNCGRRSPQVKVVRPRSRCGRSTLTCGSSPARPAPVEVAGTAGHPAWLSKGGARTGRLRRCPVQGGAAASRHSGANARRPNHLGRV